MTETPDPRAALEAKDLPTQAAGARDLALMGTWDDLPILLKIASTARSTGLRLTTGAAAADIVHRYRTGRARPAPTSSQRQALIQTVKRLDPSINPNVLMVLSAFPDRAVIERLGRLLRDPRNTVRLGATVAVRRMALSHTDLDLAPLQSALASWVQDKRLPPDSHSEVFNIIGDLGLLDLIDTVSDAPCTTATEAELQAAALARLRARHQLSTWEGLWLSDGRDVLEPGAADPEPSVLVIHRERAALDFGASEPFTLHDGRVMSPGFLADARWVRAPRLGYPEAQPALQIQGRTWFHAALPSELIEFMRERAGSFNERPDPVWAILPQLLGQAEGTAAKRAMPLASLLSGDLVQAHELLSAAAQAKRPRSEDVLWLARADDLLGHSQAAIEGYRSYLDKTGRKAWGTNLATERLAALDPSSS
ncbi:MAG: hypothetical protein EA397_14195 [Deltaproteobacteria bacterium]|nr:MAG: hypothetical protein EA397_14195 [Deltaproteobacteria bacterium]